MIVKNAENEVLTAIESVSGIADEIVILDTGSTDQTVERVRPYANLVVQASWNDDFAEARNLSLEEATGDWILFLDADETLHPEDAKELKELIQRTDREGFFLQLINRMEDDGGSHEEVSPSVRLFRNRPEYRFKGAIHEQIVSSIPHESLGTSHVRLIHAGNMISHAKNRERGRRNIRILEKEVGTQPENDFHRFNLGVEYMVRGRYQAAIEQFELAKAHMNGTPMWLTRFYKVWAYCCIREERWEQAENILKEALEQYPDFPDLYYLQGMLAISRQSYEAAMRPFYTCLAIGDSTNGKYISEKGMGTDKPYFSLGSVYEEFGENKKAKLCYRNALEWNPAHIAAGARLARLFLNEQSEDKSVDYFQTIYDVSQSDDLLTMARIFYKAKCFPLYERFIQQALEKGADGDQIRYWQGMSCYDIGKWQEMKEYCLQIEPSSKYYNRSRLLLLLSAWDPLHSQKWQQELTRYGMHNGQTFLDLADLSLELLIRQLAEGEERFPSSQALIEERRRLERILQGTE